MKSKASKKEVCRPQPLIVVGDVEASSRWYCKLLNAKNGHGGAEYEQILSGRQMILQLHAWETDHRDHEHMGNPSIKSRGNGVVLWFQFDDFDKAVSRVQKLKAKVLVKPFINENASHREIWVRDPDGYTVVLAGKYGDV